MTWILYRDGREVYCGTYGQAIEAAETFELCARSFHPDGTELAPRVAPGVRLLPEGMIPAVRRRAA